MRGQAEIDAAYDRVFRNRPAEADLSDVDLDLIGLHRAAMTNARGASLPAALKMREEGMPFEIIIKAVSSAAFFCGVATGVELERGGE